MKDVSHETRVDNFLAVVRHEFLDQIAVKLLLGLGFDKLLSVYGANVECRLTGPSKLLDTLLLFIMR